METNLTTENLVASIITHLTEMGFTNAGASERWEGDGVYEVSCDQSKLRIDNEELKTWSGWTLSVSGNDNPLYPAGVDFCNTCVGIETLEDHIVCGIDSWEVMEGHINRAIASTQ